ncbi:MAG: trigger factor [Chloroflexi bacterium]|nr:trigger factor [Chloroflexota bacterium]
MKVTTEHTPDCNAVVTVEVDDERTQSALKTAAQRVSRARPIPGFRPGKAPYAMIERAFGKEFLLDEAIDGMAQQIYRQVLKDEKIDVYDSGKLDVVQKEPVILKFTIPTRPVVTLGDYHSISLKPRPVEVTDAEVDEVVARFQREAAEMVPVTRAVQLNDLVTIDVNGGLEGRDPFNREGLQVTVEKASGVFPWLEQLVGANPAETRTVTYTYPDDASENLKGKVATYTVTVTDVKEPHLPELNDEFAKSISSFETFDLFKRRIRANLYEEKERVESDRFSDEVLDTIVEQSQIAYPASMLEDEIDQDIAQAKELASRLGMTWDKYLELGSRDEAAYRADARPRAEKRLKRLLIMLQLVEEEKVEASGKEVDVEIDERARAVEQQGGNAAQVRRNLSTPESRRDIELNLKLRKMVDLIVAMAKGEPTSGKIVTPEMLRQEMRARELEQSQAKPPAPGGLITDPSQVTSANWPKGLDHPLTPGEDEQNRTRR